MGHGAGGHLGVDVLDLSDEGLGLAPGVVEAEGEVVAEVALLTHFEDFVEFSVFVSEAEGELAGVGLYDLEGGDVEVEVAVLLDAEAGGDVVEEGGVEADERGEALGDVDGGDVVGRGGAWIVCLGVFDVAVFAAEADPGEV